MTSAEVPRAFSSTDLDPVPPLRLEGDPLVELAQDGLVIDLRDEAVVEVSSAVLPVLNPTIGLLAASRWQRTAKRAIDVVGSIVALLLLAPVLVLIAAAIKLDSRGPILYRQARLGKNEEPFTFLKFRSMYLDAESRKADLLGRNEVSGPVFKIKDDPRITPVGRFLRRTSLDELPQLLHVLSGKMSLVGFRPPLPEEVESYTPLQRQRFLIKPGLTCIWQVSGRSDLDFATWMQMDLDYISNWSLSLDWRLLIKTFAAVVSGRGAY